MLKNPATKYRPDPHFNFPQRTWPNKQLVKAPIWLSTDLRDGNQSLFDPMSVETKLVLFNELLQVGLKEIEVGFPAASTIDFNFLRRIIEENRIPDDVTVMVMTQARNDLIEKTINSLIGSNRVIVHLYNAIAPVWRDMVFGLSIQEVQQLVRDKVGYLKSLTDQHPETEWILQYSPETFSAAEPEVALMVCNTAIETWEATPSKKMIINLPSSVENTTPNLFADKIEWMSTHLMHRDSVILSVHPHNDRGTGVATAELAMLAGAERIEGCLFGNGERCGNVDITTLALNLYSQGIDPELDFSNINRTAKIIESCTQLPIHPRHPYVGDLVFTAFSGSHQDAIKKGFALQQENAQWKVPYLPIDPKDLGRTYESVIRVNSQSGKGGIAYLLERDFGIIMPRRLQIEFSNEVQKIVDASESEISSHDLYRLFDQTYLNLSNNNDSTINYSQHQLYHTENGETCVELTVTVLGNELTYTGIGNGPIDAAMNALSLPVEIMNYEEKAVSSGANACALAIIELNRNDGTSKHGAGLDQNIIVASFKAIVSALNRLALDTEIYQALKIRHNLSLYALKTDQTNTEAPRV